MAMAASASDIRSALSLPSQAPAQGAPPPRKQSTSTRKPEGISRELYSLIGPSAPSLQAQLAKPRLKEKPNLGGGVKVKWELRPFRNGARQDSLKLRHWEKSTADPDADYTFAKYNVQSTSYTYSQDDYNRYLEDEQWTKEETDYLFSIVHEYDSRWYVIHDRYDYPGSERSLEDLKDRYLGVCRKLIRSRPWAGDESSRTAVLQSLLFDKDREVTRKRYIASLAERTPREIEEEEALYIEIKRLEQRERQFKKDRDELLRTLLGIESGLPDVVAEEDSNVPSATGDLKKRKRGAMEVDSPNTPSSASNVISLGPPAPRRPQSVKSQAQDAVNCITRVDVPPTLIANKGTHTPVYMRSFKLAAPKPSQAPKITQVLTELGVSATRLVMYTRDNCAQFEALLDAAAALVETKKVVDKVEQDIRIARARLGSRASEGAETGTGTGTGPGTTAATPMDVDENADADGEAETERAPSVVSTRSTRSRRLTRGRSASVSSVETSATVSTRAGTKRLKRG